MGATSKRPSSVLPAPSTMASASASGPSKPSVRRKSSAQNILSTFRSASSSNPPQTATGLTMQIPSGALNSGMNGYVGSATPITSTPMSREWDAQSLASDSMNSNQPLTAGANGTPTLTQGTTAESLRDLVMKRMVTLTYLRNVHEGRSHWFNTVMITKAELEKVFDNNSMRKRTLRFAILGMSLSAVFDNTNASDLLKTLLNILAEYDQSKDENYKPKMRFFRPSKASRRQAGAMNDYAMSFPEAGEASYLVTPHVPFPLDYHQTLLSLLDILSEVYHKISKILGPSPMPHSGHHMMGPLGVLSPTPGVSYIFQGSETSHTTDSDGSLWGIANGPHMASGLAIGGMMSPPASWSPTLGDMVIKIDSKLKKIIALLLKELDQFARNAIRDELASLDPLLRNQALPDGAREQYDFEGPI